MNRRQILRFGLLGAASLGTIALGQQVLRWPRPLVDGHLQESGRLLMAAVARAVLKGTLADEPVSQARQINEHLDRVSITIQGFAPHAQSELAQLLLLLEASPGRRWFAGLDVPWHEASSEQVTSALEHLRTARWALQQQAYHALRDITNASYYSEPGTWAHLGYPGPIPI